MAQKKPRSPAQKDATRRMLEANAAKRVGGAYDPDKYVAPEVMHEALEQAGWMAMDGSHGVFTRYAPSRDGAAELSESLPMRDAYDVMLKERSHRKTNIWFMVVAGVLDQSTGYPASSESVALNRWVKATGKHDLLQKKQVHAVPKGGTFSIVDETGRSPGLDRREHADLIFRGGKMPLDEATALYRKLDLASAGLLIGDDRSARGKPKVWTLTFKLPPSHHGAEHAHHHGAHHHRKIGKPGDSCEHCAQPIQGQPVSFHTPGLPSKHYCACHAHHHLHPRSRGRRGAAGVRRLPA